MPFKNSAISSMTDLSQRVTTTVSGGLTVLATPAWTSCGRGSVRWAWMVGLYFCSVQRERAQKELKNAARRYTTPSYPALLVKVGLTSVVPMYGGYQTNIPFN